VQSSNRPRIVIADDHRDLLDAIRSILAPACDVAEAVTNGEAAVDAVMRVRPDVVILDMAMPRLDGLQAAARIKASGSAARVVFLSNHAGDDFVVAGIARGAAAFVPKMHMARDLLAAVLHARAGRTFVPSAAILPRCQGSTAARHALQLFADDASLVRSVVAFFETALAEGGAIVANVTAPHRQAIEGALRAIGVDVAALLQNERYIARDADETIAALFERGLPDQGQFDALFDPVVERALAAADGPTPHVAVYGESAPVLGARGETEAMLRLERLCTKFVAARPVSILCGYPTDMPCREATLRSAAICQEHSTIVAAEHRL